MGNRMKSLAIWTTGVWTKESMLMRWMEKKLVDGVTRWSADGGAADHSRFLKVDKVLSSTKEPELVSNASVYEGFLTRAIRRSS